MFQGMESENANMDSIEGSGTIEVVPSNFEEYSKRYDEVKVKKIANSFEFDESSRKNLKDIALFVAHIYDGISNNFTQKELQDFELRVSAMSAKYQENKELLTNLTSWCKARKNLVRVLKFSATELDRNLKTANYGRLIGSFVELVNSLEIGILENLGKNMAEYVGGISPTLALVTESAFLLAPHLGYLGLMSCFGELVMSKSILNNVLKATKEDMDLFEPLQKWYKETDDLNASTKALFPYGIDLNIVKSISKTLPGLETHLKIFSAVFISNVRSNHDLFRDGIFVSKIFLFCRSDAAKEWYSRITKREHPIYLEGAKIFFRNELRELARISPDSNSTFEIGRFTVKQSSAFRFPQIAMNCMTLYSAIKDLQDNTKHSASEMLREMAKSASAFLGVMENVRYELSRVHDC